MSNKLWDKKQKTFRAAIKEIRTDKELKQTQLAKKLKNHKVMYQNMNVVRES